MPIVQKSISFIIIQTSGNSKPPVHGPKAPNTYKSTLLQTSLFDYDRSFSVLHFQQLRILLAFDFLKSKNNIQITGSGEHGCRGQNFSITAAGGELVLHDQKGVTKVVISIRITISFPKVVGAWT